MYQQIEDLDKKRYEIEQKVLDDILPDAFLTVKEVVLENPYIMFTTNWIWQKYHLQFNPISSRPGK